jgi:hypothetical protein
MCQAAGLIAFLSVGYYNDNMLDMERTKLV